MNQLNKETIVGEAVASNYQFAEVFKQHNIDFCCNGNRSIHEAAKKAEVDVEVLMNELNQVSKQSTEDFIDIDHWDLDLLADYIEKTHHRYVNRSIATLFPLLNKVAKVHGESHPELLQVEKLFNESAQDLAVHMKKEELILFPYIRNLVTSNQRPEAHFGTVKNPIAQMHSDHDSEGERFRTINELTDHYTPPKDACNTYKVSYALLKEFEDNLHRHIHLENNVLFPKAIALEEERKAE